MGMGIGIDRDGWGWMEVGMGIRSKVKRLRSDSRKIVNKEGVFNVSVCV